MTRQDESYSTILATPEELRDAREYVHSLGVSVSFFETATRAEFQEQVDVAICQANTSLLTTLLQAAPAIEVLILRNPDRKDARRTMIGAMIRRSRWDNGDTLAEVGAKVGLTRARVGQIEKGDFGKRSRQTVQKVARAVGLLDATWGSIWPHEEQNKMEGCD